MSDKIPLYRSSLNTARHCNEVDIWRQSDLETHAVQPLFIMQLIVILSIIT